MACSVIFSVVKRLLILVVVLSFSACNGSVEIPSDPEDIFGIFRSEISSCTEVCKYGDWYFARESEPYTASTNMVRSKARMKAIQKIYYYIFAPDLYMDISKSIMSKSYDRILQKGDVQIVIVDSELTVVDGESRIFVIVGVKLVGGL